MATVKIPTTAEGKEAARLLTYALQEAPRNAIPAALRVYEQYLKQNNIIEFERSGLMGDTVTLFTKAVDGHVHIIGLVTTG